MGRTTTAHQQVSSNVARSGPALQNPMDICSEFSSVDECTVGKLARALACRSVFGSDVLQQSTITGDHKREA